MYEKNILFALEREDMRTKLSKKRKCGFKPLIINELALSNFEKYYKEMVI